VKQHSIKRESTGVIPGAIDAGAAESKSDADKACNFDISVRYRHNAEWQGSIYWAEKDVTKQFSSIVELIKLMDNALAE